GMVSTTYVQFLKGSLLVFFSLVLTVLIFARGLHVGGPERQPVFLGAAAVDRWLSERLKDAALLPADGAWKEKPYLRLRENTSGEITTWRKVPSRDPGLFDLHETQTLTVTTQGRRLVNGLPQGRGEGERDLWPVGNIKTGSNDYFTRSQSYPREDH